MREKGSREALQHVSVYDSVSGRGTTTNAYGYFNIILGLENVLRFSYAGYAPSFVRQLDRDTAVQVLLAPRILDSVVVMGQRHRNDQPGMNRVPITFLQQFPTVAGEPDVLKALATTAGVTTGSEGNSNLYVRGGTPDQNLILLDEAPVYNVTHLFGFVSVFNVGAVRDVSLLRGSFPAKYGGRLSSIVNVTMKEGNKQQHEGEFGIGLISSRFSIGGPLAKNKTSFFLSARASYLGLLLLPTYRNFRTGRADQYFNYSMHDLNFKFNHEFSKKSQLFVSSYFGHDYYHAAEGRLNERSRFGLDWGNQTASIRYQTELSPTLFARAVLLYTRYVYDVALSTEENNMASFFLKSRSFIHDYTGKGAFEWYPHRDHEVQFGFEATRHQYAPAQLRSTDEMLDNSNQVIHANEFALYVQDQWNLSNRVTVRPGLRYSGFRVQRHPFYAFEPRLNVRWRIAQDRVTLDFDYSRMRQYLHLLTGNSAGLSNDVWVPAVPQVPPQTADQWSLGVTRILKNYTLTLDYYYKRMTDVAEYRQGTNFLVALDRPWQQLIEIGGTGRAHGFEAMVERKSATYSGWITYNLSWNHRRFSGINSGEWFPARFDRRHVLNWINQVRLNSKWHATASWYFATGHAVTLPVALITDVDGDRIPVYEKRNNARMPLFHRLDIGFKYTWRTRRDRLASVFLGVYNLYNRANPFFIDFAVGRISPDSSQWQTMPAGGQASRVGAFPFLPFVSYHVKF